MLSGYIRIAVLVCAPVTLQAQPDPMTLRGTVLDPARTAVPGARITATIEGRGDGLSMVSDLNGQFSLPLEPGKYSLAIAKEGFVTVTQTVSLPRDGSGLLEIVLQVAPLRDVVTVTEISGYLTA